MEKIVKSVIVGLLAGAGMVLMWVFVFMLMTFVGNLTGSVFMGAMTPMALLTSVVAGVGYYMTHG